MEKEIIESMVNKQREYFYSGETLQIKFRIEALKKLKSCIKFYEEEILQSLKIDLGKSDYESYMCEVGLVLSEISYMVKNIKKLTGCRRVKTPLAQFRSKSYKMPTPYGNVLIMSPWNYPFLLTMTPLIDAIASGNTAMVKPSAYSPATSEIILKIIKECFDEKYVGVVTGGRKENASLLDEKFDLVFFTGSQSVGKEVLRKCAEHLTPAILELGGKSPCIVDDSAKIKLTAKRIVFGKFINVGQTCVAPDYIYCDEKIKGELIKELVYQIKLQYGENPLENDDYGKIINEKHFDRICGLIDKNKVVCGGKHNKDSLKIEPTILDNVTLEDSVMSEEIFGPILPIMTYKNLDEVITTLQDKAKPLALYMFSNYRKNIDKITKTLRYGGGCINDTIIHIATSEMGFGGVGESGMGSYHGKAGFDAFTHYKSIVDKKTWLDLPMRYQPYNRKKYSKIIKMFLK